MVLVLPPSPAKHGNSLTPAPKQESSPRRPRTSASSSVQTHSATTDKHPKHSSPSRQLHQSQSSSTHPQRRTRRGTSCGSRILWARHFLRLIHWVRLRILPSSHFQLSHMPQQPLFLQRGRPTSLQQTVMWASEQHPPAPGSPSKVRGFSRTMFLQHSLMPHPLFHSQLSHMPQQPLFLQRGRRTSRYRMAVSALAPLLPARSSQSKAMP